MDVAARISRPRKVSLPMYNLPEMRSLNAAFWDALRVELARRGVCDTSATLDFERRPVPAEIEADSLFTQVCGYPLQTIYRGQATILGAPVYAAAHCSGAGHAGVIIVPIRLQQSPFQFWHEPTAQEHGQHRRWQAVLRLRDGDT